jgi:hypothetical protein
MSETKFTPGPWMPHYAYTDEGLVFLFISTDKEANEEDFKLIAAAPDMYDALKELCRYADDSNDCQYGTLSTRLVKDIAEAALTKARGEA